MSLALLSLCGVPALAEERACLGGVCIGDGIELLAKRSWNRQSLFEPAQSSAEPFKAPADVIRALSRYRGSLMDGRALPLLARVHGVCAERPVILQGMTDDDAQVSVDAEFVPEGGVTQRFQVREVEIERFAPMAALLEGATRLCDDLVAKFPPTNPHDARGCEEEGASYESGTQSLLVIVRRAYVDETHGTERLKLRRLDGWSELSRAEKQDLLQQMPQCSQ